VTEATAARSGRLTGALALSYRRLDYWARCGYLRPAGEGRGSGTWRSWPEVEQRVAALMLRLVEAGLLVPVAAEIARHTIEEGLPTGYARLGDGVHLSVVVDVE
jgi:hypothetical protein